MEEQLLYRSYNNFPGSKIIAKSTIKKVTVGPTIGYFFSNHLRG